MFTDMKNPASMGCRPMRAGFKGDAWKTQGGQRHRPPSGVKQRKIRSLDPVLHDAVGDMDRAIGADDATGQDLGKPLGGVGDCAGIIIHPHL